MSGRVAVITKESLGRTTFSRTDGDDLYGVTAATPMTFFN